MPAAHYIIAVQVALVAASAAYLRSDKPAETILIKEPGKPNPRALAAHPGYEDDGDDFLPPPKAKPFAQADTAASRQMPERVMGFRPGVVARPRLPVEEARAGKKEVEFTPPPRAVPLEGTSLAEDEPEEIEFDPVPDGQGYSITADSATNFDLTTKTVVFAGNVSLRCTDFVLTSDRLVVHMETEGGTMKRMLANGNVDVKLLQGSVNERYHGMGEEADFDPATQKIILLGWPRIIGQGREHRAASAATRMTLFTKPARLETVGRAQTRIVPGEGGELPGLGGS